MGIRAVVAGQDTADAATQLALSMAGIAVRKENERVPIDMQPVMTWPAEIGLDPGPLVGRILQRPTTAVDSSDMRDAFGGPQTPVWIAFDAGRWANALRDLRRRSLLSPGIALADRARANGAEWRVEILAKLSGLVDRVVERGFVGLPDASFVLGEFDEALTRATVDSELRYPEGGDFDRAVGDLREELEDLPHAEAMHVRFGLAGAAVAVPLALLLPRVLSGVPEIAMRVVALLLGLVLGLIVASAYQRAREARLIGVRERALATLGAWLVGDLERLVVIEVTRGVAQLREAMAQEHLPALDQFMRSHVIVERALKVASSHVPSGFRVKSITELTGVEVPPTNELDPRHELRRFLRGVPGRGAWRTLTPLDIGRRLLGQAREGVLPAAQNSLEAVMAEVLDGEHQVDAESRIQVFLGGAERERAIDRRRMRGWCQDSDGVLLTSDAHAPIWDSFPYGENAFAWESNRQMTLHLQLEWEEEA